MKPSERPSLEEASIADDQSFGAPGASMSIRNEMGGGGIPGFDPTRFAKPFATSDVAARLAEGHESLVLPIAAAPVVVSSAT
ncbi:MAG: hypothetical protein JO189_18895 [Deltaproteobacteria bacterium]|nr:hypothetical protein [Deltaproteobacteria bacterium]